MRSAAALLAVIFGLTACGSSRHATTAALVDGHRFGFIRSATETSVTFDPADFLSGDYARLVARRDGVTGKGEVPNDYYAPNPSAATATLRVIRDPTVTVVKCDAGCRQGAPARWSVVVRSLTKHPWPWWLTIRNGVVTQVDEQYVP
jgi:hypothetical protein